MDPLRERGPVGKLWAYQRIIGKMHILCQASAWNDERPVPDLSIGSLTASSRAKAGGGRAKRCILPPVPPCRQLPLSGTLTALRAGPPGHIAISTTRFERSRIALLAQAIYSSRPLGTSDASAPRCAPRMRDSEPAAVIRS
jgi:hypothetical protein